MTTCMQEATPLTCFEQQCDDRDVTCTGSCKMTGLGEECTVLYGMLQQ